MGHTTGLLDNIICLCEESGDDEPVWSGRLHETKHDVMWGMCVRMVERGRRGEGRAGGVGVDGWFCPLLHIVLFFLALVVVAAGAEECMIYVGGGE